MSAPPRLVLAALALPLVALGASAAWQASALAGATPLRIPVAGDDPRDLIRGHEVLFRYGWRVTGNPALCQGPSRCTLCVEEGGASVRALPAGSVCSGAIDLRASGLTGSVFYDGQLHVGGRLWVSEATADALTRQLRNRPMVVVARLTRAGRLVNDRLEPR